MGNKQTTLTPSEARTFYDKFGEKQDTQGFYENPALEDLIVHADFQHAQKVFEFGCGTGKFAERLLQAGTSACGLARNLSNRSSVHRPSTRESAGE